MSGYTFLCGLSWLRRGPCSRMQIYWVSRMPWQNTTWIFSGFYIYRRHLSLLFFPGYCLSPWWSLAAQSRKGAPQTVTQHHLCPKGVPGASNINPAFSRFISTVHTHSTPTFCSDRRDHLLLHKVMTGGEKEGESCMWHLPTKKYIWGLLRGPP